MCLLNHWRVLNDGRIVYAYFSDVENELKPLVQEFVRAEVRFGGLVLKPTSNGTHITYVLNVSFRFVYFLCIHYVLSKFLFKFIFKS
jgi:hypothetical protein